MGVKLGQHSANSCIQQGVVVGFLNKIVSNLVEYIGKCTQIIE